jgi:hypothetical protein
MRPAPLPRRTGQRRTDRAREAAMGVGDDQPHPGQPAGGQRPQERQPAGTILVRRDVQAENIAAAVGVDPDRDQGVHVHRLAAFTHLDDQGVRPHEPVTGAVKRPVPERLHLRSRCCASLMSAEADAVCGADYGTSSPERVNTRNG